MTVRTFNGARELWPSPMFVDIPAIEGPVTATCTCEEPITEADPGVMYSNDVPVHLECFLRGTFGGVNHQNGTCSCCGGSEDPDPPGLTRREAARASVAHRDPAGVWW